MLRFLLLAAVCLSIAACKTIHKGPRGAATAQQLTATTYRIVARGDTSTSTATVSDIMLWRAAKLTRSVGGTHFVIESKSDATRVETVISPGYERKETVGKREYVDRYEATAETHTHPGLDAVIRVLTLESGQQPPNGAYAADEVLEFVGRRVKPA